MKTCPICKTSLFDDMEVCYGCMYAFGSKPELEQRASEQRAQEHVVPLTPAAPVTSPMAGWSVRLELRDSADPTRSWSMELVPSQVPSNEPANASSAVAAAI